MTTNGWLNIFLQRRFSSQESQSLCADHYTGLRETWDYGLVHCNEMTGKLVVQIVGISPEIVRGHKMDTPVQIEGQ